MSGEELVLEVWDTEFEVEPRPDDARYRWVCLYCLAREGRIRWISFRNRSMMCYEHAMEFRAWRKAQGLPPLKDFVGKRLVRGMVKVKRANRQAILFYLDGRALSTSQIAWKVGMSRAGVRAHLKELIEEGMVACDDSWPRLWRRM